MTTFWPPFLSLPSPHALPRFSTGFVFVSAPFLAYAWHSGDNQQIIQQIIYGDRLSLCSPGEFGALAHPASVSQVLRSQWQTVFPTPSMDSDQQNMPRHFDEFLQIPGKHYSCFCKQAFQNTIGRKMRQEGNLPVSVSSWVCNGSLRQLLITCKGAPILQRWQSNSLHSSVQRGFLLWNPALVLVSQKSQPLLYRRPHPSQSLFYGCEEIP